MLALTITEEFILGVNIYFSVSLLVKMRHSSFTDTGNYACGSKQKVKFRKIPYYNERLLIQNNLKMNVPTFA